MKQINFYRPYIQIKRKTEIFILLIVSLIGFLIVALFIGNSFVEMENKKLVKKINNYEQQKKLLQEDISTLKEKEKQKNDSEIIELNNEYERKIQILKNTINNSAQISNNRERPNINTLDDIEKVNGAWLTNVVIKNKENFLIKGQAFDAQSATQAINALNDMNWIDFKEKAFIEIKRDSKNDILSFEVKNGTVK